MDSCELTNRFTSFKLTDDAHSSIVGETRERVLFTSWIELGVEAVGRIGAAGESLRDAMRPMVFTLRFSSLFRAVTSVIERCAQEEVRGADADRIVALVQYPQTVGNRSSFEDPRHAMRSRSSTFSVIAPCKEAVAAIDIGLPDPAPTGLFDLRPEEPTCMIHQTYIAH